MRRPNQAAGREGKEAKAMTLRLPPEQAEELEAVASVEGRPVAEVVREAIASHIDARRRDAAFRARLRASLERNRRILERLSKRETGVSRRGSRTEGAHRRGGT